MRALAVALGLVVVAANLPRWSDRLAVAGVAVAVFVVAGRAWVKGCCR